MIVIQPTSGLGNKLRVIFSYYELAKKQNKKLYVIWIINNACNGFFLDYFEPLDDVIFEKTNLQNLDIYYKGYDRNPDYYPNYKNLKLLPHIIEKINNKKKIFGDNYISVHIRRTDHILLAEENNKYTTDEMFIEYIEREKNNSNLYIATDNKETYDFFNKYNKNICVPYHNTIDTLRQTTLEDSIIDLYMCVYSSKFMGSGFSSFSELIYNLRNLNKK
jgi:hypothetical protein